ncbi:putative F-box protein At1g47790 [Mangifera indica]|uniref:putative F-box protein At1g47790 n=1 Tax=Mangifera indica TaxID=29780 RepID=UPI001CF9AD43|nr:putative F-box protein At1g47790 [Mangifera indica]
MANIPREIKFNIFSRLPVKIIGICRCVSKQWLGLLTDPYFLQIHLERAQKYRQLLCLDQSIENDDEEDNQKQVFCFFARNMEAIIQYRFSGLIDGYIYMIPSGHGLVCLVNRGIFFAFNPSMKKFARLPKAQASTCGGVEAGFGYIKSTNEYKLVHLYNIQDEEELDYTIKCEIMTLSEGSAVSSNSWKQLEIECPVMVSGWGVLVDMKFYWMVWEGCYPTVDQLILSLDLETETFDFIPHPHVTSYIEGNDTFLVELQGQLCLVDTFAYPPITDVWILKDPVKKIWVKEYTIDLTKLEGFDDELTQIYILGYLNEELIINSQKERLDFYNVGNGMFRRGRNLHLLRDTGICLYTETFFLLND